MTTLTQKERDQLQKTDETKTHIAQFNPNDHTIEIKNKSGKPGDYLPVQWRLVWFREQCPQGSIETSMEFLDMDKEITIEAWEWDSAERRSKKVSKTGKGITVFKAHITDGRGGEATGFKSECSVSFPDYIEKAETGAIGRALAALGYGTQFAPELDEEHRIVDSPVNRSVHNGGKT